MKTLMAKNGEHCFGGLIDLAGAEPAARAKQSLPILVALVVEECRRPKALGARARAQARKVKAKG